MNKLVDIIKSIYNIKELRDRILFTLGLLLVYRLGAQVVLPGVDSLALSDLSSRSDGGGLLGILNAFTGGAFANASIFALGIMPYISASIVVQLMGVALPYLQKLQKEGESGRKKITQITRWLTIFICTVQAPAYLYGLSALGVPDSAFIFGRTPMFIFTSIIILVTGCIFAMWLGEKITDRGIGNGISLLITVGIVASLPLSFTQNLISRISESNGGLIMVVIELAVWLVIILLSILLVMAVRQIPVQYARRNSVPGSQSSGMAKRQYIPLKLNASGVMPIIFAQALMFLPSLIFQNSSFGATFSNIQGFWYNAVFFLMIVIFTYFYTAIMMNPNQMADELKRNGSFIPGIKPGKKTADFIEGLISRLVFPGSIFLGIIAILPAFAMNFGIQQGFAYFFGGTSLLIMVGVVLDTLQQIESHLLNRHYDGLIKGGRIKGRSTSSAVTMSQTL